jgi:hypothetical protein
MRLSLSFDIAVTYALEFVPELWKPERYGGL